MTNVGASLDPKINSKYVEGAERGTGVLLSNKESFHDFSCQALNLLFSIIAERQVSNHQVVSQSASCSGVRGKDFVRTLSKLSESEQLDVVGEHGSKGAFLLR